MNGHLVAWVRPNHAANPPKYPMFVVRCDWPGCTFQTRPAHSEESLWRSFTVHQQFMHVERTAR